MDESQFPKIPWKIVTQNGPAGEYLEVWSGPEKQLICTVGPLTPETKAIARLIIKGPEMYQFLKQVADIHPFTDLGHGANWLINQIEGKTQNS